MDLLSSNCRRATRFIGRNLRGLKLKYWSRKAFIESLSADPERLRTLSSPADSAVLQIVAREQAAKGNLDFAVECLDAAARLGPEDNPSDADVWNIVGNSYFNSASDGFIKAEPAYRSALARSSAEFAAFLGVSECLSRQKRLDEAAAARETWFRSWIESAESDDLRLRQDDARRRGVPAIMFVAMLKSASEFIRENLIDALNVPEMHIGVGTVPRDAVVSSAIQQLAKGGAICRSHMSGDNLSALIANGVDRLVVHIRDPRQSTVSWTHMMRRLSGEEFRYATHMYDPPVPDEFRDWGLQRQLDWSVQNFLPGQLQWLESWAEALDRESSIPISLSTFEEFRQDQDLFFRKLSDFFGIAEVRLPDLSEQSAVAMRNFRSGDLDEWRSVLTPDQMRTFEPRFEPLAERFGWEA